MNNGLYLGLISGTSMDAVDCALVDIQSGLPKVVGHEARPLPDELKLKLQHLCSNRDIDLRLLGSTDIEVARLFADTANTFLAGHGLQAGDIQAIGSHGQTIWHEPPRAADQCGYTLQIGDPNTIAQRTGITTVADFRRRDMAAGGHGAPIVPILHQALFQSSSVDRIVLNLGGIANITLLPKDGSALAGLDTGPASVLMDSWINRHKGLPYDKGGAWAASANAHPQLLAQLLEEPYFRAPAPKSTGRELFNLGWLERSLDKLGIALTPDVVQATLLALSAETVAREVSLLLDEGEILVCGGGSHNSALLQQLALRLPRFHISSTTQYGLDADYVEAAAFGWFAYRTLQREPIAFYPFTGAAHAVIAGGVYYS